MFFRHAPDHVVKFPVRCRQAPNDLVGSPWRVVRRLWVKVYCFTDFKFVLGHRGCRSATLGFTILTKIYALDSSVFRFLRRRSSACLPQAHNRVWPMPTDIAKYSIELFKPGHRGDPRFVKTIWPSRDRSTKPASSSIPGDWSCSAMALRS
jgi:hypothetical protein